MRETETATKVLDLTEAAQATVAGLRAEEADAERLALWVEVVGTDHGAYSYDLYFQAVADATPGDAVSRDGSVPVVVPAASVDALRGATLDVSDGELVLINPNRPPKPPWERDDLEVDSPLARRVEEVLAEEINPQIAMHGGQAELVGVAEGTVYLRLLGGCQGCGLASVTLSQGIEVVLKEEIPELVGVVDVTDHESGTNPYFQGAKK